METVFNQFNDIQHLPLRVFNRVVFMNNLNEDFGPSKVREYIETFNEVERKQMYIMQLFIRKNGPKRAKEMATEGLTFEE